MRAVHLLVALGLATCRPVMSPPRRAEMRSVVVRLVGTSDCPPGFVTIHAGSTHTDTNGEGVATVEVEAAPHRARVHACGRTATFELPANAGAVTYALPPSSDPTLPRGPWPAPKRRGKSAPCAVQDVASGTRIFAGDVTALERDARRCALHFHADGSAWMLPLEGERRAVRVGTAAPLHGEQIVVGYDGGAIVSVDRRTYARTLVATNVRAIALSPRTDVLLFGHDFDLMARRTSLEARWPDGRTRHLLDRAHTHVAFSADGRWLVTLEPAPAETCHAMHLFALDHPGGQADRVLRRICRSSDLLDWGLPRFVGDRHVLVVADEGQLLVDVTTGETVRRWSRDDVVFPFAHGVIVSGDRVWDPGAGRAAPFPLRFDLAYELSDGDVVVLRERSRGVDATERGAYDAVLVDTTTGAARTVAEGVDREVATSPTGLLVFAEGQRFVVVAPSGAPARALPREHGTIESFSPDGRWMAVRGPIHKGRAMWHHLVSVDGSVVVVDPPAWVGLDDGRVAYLEGHDGIYLDDVAELDRSKR